MVTLESADIIGLMTGIRAVIKPRVLLWLLVAAVLTVSLVLLTIAISDGAVPSQDRTVLAWVVGRDAPLLAGFVTVINALTSNLPAMAIGIAGVGFLWLIGLTRASIAFAIVGGIVGLVAFVGDLTLGEIVGRSRPLLENSTSSFPSGHVFGSTVFFGF